MATSLTPGTPVVGDDAGVEGPGSKRASTPVIVLSVLGVSAGAIVLLYCLVKIWPHPTPSGAPVQERLPAAGDSAIAPGDIRDTVLAPAPLPAPRDSDGQAGIRPSVRGSGPGQELQAPLARGGMGGPLTCDTTIVPRVYYVPPDSLRDPECVSLFTYAFPVWAEQRLLLIVVLTGALGGLLHAIRSLAWYVGNRELRLSWLPYYLLLPIAGAIMAFAFYVVLRGGLFSPSASIRETSPFGFAAIALLVGMFTPQAALKLKQVAETFFARPSSGKESQPQEEAHADTGIARAPTTPSQAPVISRLEPAQIPVASSGQLLTIFGEGFVASSLVRVGGSAERAPDSVSTDGTVLKTMLRPEEIQGPGPVAIQVVNPESQGGGSQPVSLMVRAT
jgi:hypothetical protein